METPGPGQTASEQVTERDGSGVGNRYLLGLWEVQVAADHQSVEIIPQRAGEMHLNAVKLLESTKYDRWHNCLEIEVYAKSDQTLRLLVTIRHPYPNDIHYCVFDVRGIVVTDADYSFPSMGRSIARGESLPIPVEPDGYTSLFNPTEYAQALPVSPALKYWEGESSTGGDLSATLNPFVAFLKSDRYSRRIFHPTWRHSSIQEYFSLRIPDGPFQFGYAVDASWKQVLGPITDPVKQFPPDANCIEAYHLDFLIDEELEPVPGSETLIGIEAFDHQGHETVQSAFIEAPGLFSGIIELTYVSPTSNKSCMFAGIVPNEFGADYGDYPMLVRVTDTQEDPNLGPIDAWQVFDLSIRKGWSRTWGEWYPYCQDVALDSLGGIYVAGSFEQPCDFDPGPGADWQSSTTRGRGDAYIAKYNSRGGYQWTRTWGGDEEDYGTVLASDNSGNVYVAGGFSGTADFDPGPGSEIRTAMGYWDTFLSRFNSDGEFLGVRTWSGMNVGDIAFRPPDDLIVVGSFYGTVDFDPGPGSEAHTSPDHHSAYLLDLSSWGEFRWVRTWGTSGGTYTRGAAVDGTDSICVTGNFRGTGDFDPGSGVEEHTCNGDSDVFLSKFSSNGDFLWAAVWGGPETDQFGDMEGGYDVSADQTGNICVTGSYAGTVDFDPGPGIDEHTSAGGSDIFLSKFTLDGDMIWALAWGGSFDSGYGEGGASVAFDSLGNVIVSGLYQETVDFDPGPGSDVHERSGYPQGPFLSKFDPDGNHLWTQTSAVAGTQIAIDFDDNAYVTGYRWAFLAKFPPDGDW